MARFSWPCGPSVAAAWLGVGAALAIGGCDSATCGAAPTAPIVGFVVTTTTGNDSTDADIYFCFTRRSTGAEACELLDILSEDDFEIGEVNTFEWGLAAPIAPGDLEGFVIRNSGGAHLFADNEWDLEHLRVEGALEGGEIVLLYDEETAEKLSEGETYDSSQCEY